ncbi:hydroxymethylbilane synthase [Fervidibacillus halotolerans]|uniref:Porphobilinogen deaminase n=1 Tax=Fervidibacillus halotolerans TaxID=2980027 RepID=A0A9E8M292_9BACI|nr:hydroxymethylbilane synthase [Fervidibacillus halotolerans]WAA13941.1 hydroxymethylbilane synthase [Fervidibacillus halotolerans]
MRKIIVGTRRSKLARTQTKWVIEKLKQIGAPFQFEIKEIVTKGDQILNVTLSKVGGKGLFVKEIEHALLNKEIDFAVHSMKDMPAILPEGLVIGAVPEREDPRDVLITKSGQSLDELPKGSVIGTSSLRRKAQLLVHRPDIHIKWIRGNIDTRLKKLKGNDYDGIILAAAGLKRLGLEEQNLDYLPLSRFIPAVGQGALAIECREDDLDLRKWLDRINCPDTNRAVRAERTFLGEMEGSCQIPIGGHATRSESGELELTAFVASPDGQTIYKENVSGTDPESLGRQAASRLSERGAKELIANVLRQIEG